VLGLQNNRTDGIVGTVAELRQCVRDVGSPWLRICLDPADLPSLDYADTLLPEVVQVHARVRDVADDGSDSSAHWPDLLRFLHQGPYRGFILIDYEGAEDPETAVPRATRYTRGLLHFLQRQQLLAAPGGAVAPDAQTPTPAQGRTAVDRTPASDGHSGAGASPAATRR
jgi:hypothetical protein